MTDADDDEFSHAFEPQKPKGIDEVVLELGTKPVPLERSGVVADAGTAASVAEAAGAATAAAAPPLCIEIPTDPLSPTDGDGVAQQTVTPLTPSAPLLLSGTEQKSAPSERVPHSHADQVGVWQEIDAIGARTAAEDERAATAAVRPRDGPTHPILYQDAVQQFRARSYDTERATIVPEEPPGNIFSRLFRFLFGPPRLKDHLLAERDLVFCIAKVPLNHNDALCERVLQTVFMRLTGAPRFAPSVGPHWDSIGFQGSDPATDLRGVGMLGLLQLLYLATRHSRAAIAASQLARHPRSAFPLALVSLSMTKLALQVLREGRLNREANKRDSVLSTVMLFYAGALHQLLRRWRREALTIVDFGPALQAVSAECRSNPARIMAAFLADEEQTLKGPADGSGPVEFGEP